MNMNVIELQKEGINLPNPLPPTPQLIERLQTHIQRLRLDITRLASDDPRFAQNRARLQSRIARLESIITGLQTSQDSSYPSHPTYPSDAKTENHPKSGTTVDTQQQSSGTDPVQCGTPAVQSGTDPVHVPLPATQYRM
jgi:hypothetical protein